MNCKTFRICADEEIGYKEHNDDSDGSATDRGLTEWMNNCDLLLVGEHSVFEDEIGSQLVWTRDAISGEISGYYANIYLDENAKYTPLSVYNILIDHL